MGFARRFSVHDDACVQIDATVVLAFDSSGPSHMATRVTVATKGFKGFDGPTMIRTPYPRVVTILLLIHDLSTV